MCSAPLIQTNGRSNQAPLWSKIARDSGSYRTRPINWQAMWTQRFPWGLAAIAGAGALLVVALCLSVSVCIPGKGLPESKRKLAESQRGSYEYVAEREKRQSSWGWRTGWGDRLWNCELENCLLLFVPTMFREMGLCVNSLQYNLIVMNTSVMGLFITLKCS